MRRVLVPAAGLALVTACSGPLTVQTPRLSGTQARACAALVRDLPAHVADQPRRDVDVDGGYAAAWGDPAIVLRCGVPRPAGLDETAACLVVNGVGWYVPEPEQQGTPSSTTVTTVGRAAYVSVRVPADYSPPSTAMVDLGSAVRRAIPEVRPCT